MTIAPKDESKRARAMWGTTRALVSNMITGVAAVLILSTFLTVMWRRDVRRQRAHPAPLPREEGEGRA